MCDCEAPSNVNSFCQRPPIMESQSPLPAVQLDKSHSENALLSARSIPCWRWWVALLIVGSFPVLAALSSTKSAGRDSQAEATLPKSVEGLLLGGGLQFGFILLLFGLSWLFSRATKDELWLRWREGIAPVWKGVLYSIGLRVLAALPLIAIGIVLMNMGFSERELKAWMQGNKPQTEGIGDAVRAGSLLYKATMLTFFSFVVAGLGEELWRGATMRALLEIAPRALSPLVKSGVVVIVSSVVFGVGHLYQGVIGVLITTVLGLALGALTLHHRAIWPSVIAHGCFDATTFLMVMLGADKMAQQAHWWLR